MSADFWNSTQRSQWQFTRESLAQARKNVLAIEKKMGERGEISQVNIPYHTYMRIFLHQLILKLGRRIAVRQIAIATAEVYTTRFLTQASIKETNPYLLVTTCLYLACKIEECSQHIRTIVNEARNLWPEYVPHDATKVAEFEFYLIQELNSYMVLHHPYRSLLQINDVFKELAGIRNSDPHPEDASLVLSPNELQNCWSIINDSYITDLHILYPPHIISVASVFMTIVLQQSSPNQNSSDPANFSLGLDSTDGSLYFSSHSRTLHSAIPEVNPFTGRVEASTVLSEPSARITMFTRWLGATNVDLEEVIDAIQEMIVLYSMWEHYDESQIKRSLSVMLLGR
ncbi:hypothetical protein BABINDRAFT_32686 [Babjeviella inositovora NRRL Y-12698]|uniref:Cyclin-like domain-containing protein n=1 Tax=Babjeviella inositovora NRRL Y-12698 TaxID=984486 RepID=A0A1E3QUW3_9ASCO|nr:uncharacterized protein BABINDRAFT_32686 [Babjeviella inositovora NRRL Y-12698]ODQ81459.1 hypothetical protein BABINDRAFT_32686 [Babjeviella inositovora NRRL Y-12698]